MPGRRIRGNVLGIGSRKQLQSCRGKRIILRTKQTWLHKKYVFSLRKSISSVYQDFTLITWIWLFHENGYLFITSLGGLLFRTPLNPIPRWMFWLTFLISAGSVVQSVVIFGYETWSVTLMEQQRLRIFENKMMRRICGPKTEVTQRWRRLHMSSSILRTLHQKSLRWSNQAG